MASLFTNVSLNRTVNITLDSVYNKKFVNKNLRKIVLKNLIKETCSKTEFPTSKKICQQIDGNRLIDGVSMASFFGPLTL